MEDLKKKVIGLVLSIILILSASTIAFAEEPSEGQKAKETDSDAKIKIEVQHALLTREGDNALVREVIKFVNEGDAVYVGKGEGEQKEVLRVSLPKKYTNLKIIGVPENKTVIRDGELITSTPLSPGSLQLTLNYAIPMSEYNEFVLDKTIFYLTEVLYILSPEGDLNVKGEGIQSSGIQEIDGERYQVFYSELKRPGEGFQLTAKPGTAENNRVAQGYSNSSTGFHSASHISRWMSSPLRGTNPHVWAMFLILLVVAIITAVGMLINEKRKKQEQLEADEKLSTLYDRLVIKEKRLFDKIKELDQQLAEGQIADEEGYKGLREQYKKMLVEVKLKIREMEELEAI